LESEEEEVLETITSEDELVEKAPFFVSSQLRERGQRKHDKEINKSAENGCDKTVDMDCQAVFTQIARY
jgi:hypothetical protein